MKLRQLSSADRAVAFKTSLVACTLMMIGSVCMWLSRTAV